MKKTESHLLLSSICGFLISCNSSSSDPLAKYDLRDTGTPDQAKEKQTHLQSGKISVELITENETSPNIVNNFMEGQLSQLKFKVILNDPKIITYRFSLTQFPNIDQPTIEQTSTPGVFTLTWLPPKGFIPPGQTGQALNVNWEIQVLTASLPELVGYAQSGFFPINVSRSTQVPKILSYDRFEKGVEEDKLISFTVTVDDPNSKSENQIPFLSFTGVPYLNTEAYCADFAGRMQLDPSRTENPERLSETKWKFYYQMDTRNMPYDRNRVGDEDQNTPSTHVCFYLSAVSGVGQTTSSKFKINIKAFYAAKVPTLKWENDTTTEVISGQENQIRFETGVDADPEHFKSQLNFPKQAAELAKLSGEKSLQCTSSTLENETKQTCVLIWTPSCTQNRKTTSFSITVRNTLAKKTKEKTWKKDFVILPASNPCSTNKAK